MKRIITTLMLLLSSLTFAVPPNPIMTNTYTSQGSVSVSPNTGVSDQFGTWTVTHTVGQDGIATNGGIRVQLPDVWHAGPRNSANRLQSTEPQSDHYVKAYTSNPDVTLRTIVEAQVDNQLVKHRKKSLDGRNERYVFVVRVLVTKGQLKHSDSLQVVYGDTSQGSRGMRGSAISSKDRPVLIAIDATGDFNFSLHTQRPLISSIPGPVAAIWLNAPSNAIPNSPINVRVALIDSEDNPAFGPETIALRYPKGITGPKSIKVPKESTGVDIPVIANTTGIFRIQATWANESDIYWANPIEVTQELPKYQLYWGDLHSHTQHSWDGVGQDAFDYARYTSRLDYYAMTDHAMPLYDGLNSGLNPTLWEDYQAETEHYHAPNEFVTLHAYECSFREPYGHHNVYFRGKAGVLKDNVEIKLPELWKLLKAGDAITIPHHTGKFPGGVNLKIHDKTYRRNFEMYSGHGLSEIYEPTHPLSFEHSVFTSNSGSLDAPTHIQDAWRQGLHVSAIASSDDHRSQPGLPHYGIAAVRATSLTRNDIFQGLYDRYTYATTGSKIIVHFSVNGTRMGAFSSITNKADIELRVHGTGIIAYAEILRWQPGDKTFKVVKRYTSGSMDLSTTWSDPKAVPGSVYYTRMQQQRPVHGRMAMAWSSPVWLGNEDKAIIESDARTSTETDIPPRIDIVQGSAETLPKVTQVRQLTHGPKHHFFGYYGMTPWDSTGDYLVCMESEFGNRLVEKDEKANVILLDTKTGKTEIINSTLAWNFQQGSMLHWLGTAPDREIIHNANLNGELKSVVVDVFTKEKRYLPKPVAAVALNGKIGACLNYARIRDTRPGYGYAGADDLWADEIHPNDDGLYIMDIATGKNRLIVSYDQVVKLEALPTEVAQEKMWFNHVLFSRDSQRIFFMARVKDANNRNVTAAFTVSTDGSELRCILPYSWGASHFDWVNDKELIITTKYQGTEPWLHVRLTDGADKSTYTPLAQETLGSDGHLHASYDEQWMVTDSYPSGPHRMRKLYLMNMDSQEIARVASFHENKAYHREWRCDLHPRWSQDNKRICIDNTQDGTRQVYVIELDMPEE